MLTFILLQAQPSGGSGISNLILIGGMILVFYFFMIRPQQKKQKEQKKFRESLKKGNMAITIGGIHGKIVAIDADTVTLEVDKGTKLTLEKSAISAEASKKFEEPAEKNTKKKLINSDKEENIEEAEEVK